MQGKIFELIYHFHTKVHRNLNDLEYFLFSFDLKLVLRLWSLENLMKPRILHMICIAKYHCVGK